MNTNPIESARMTLICKACLHGAAVAIQDRLDPAEKKLLQPAVNDTVRELRRAAKNYFRVISEV